MFKMRKKTMNLRKIVLFTLLNIVVISIGALTVYYDLYANGYVPANVEWYVLGYRADYLPDGTLFEGVWTLDLLQCSVLLMVITDLFSYANSRFKWV